jgi:hypothetical protein
MTQPDLFSTPRARRTDPPTSKAAAEAIAPALGEQMRRVLWAVCEMERTGSLGATAHEIVMRLAYTGNAPQQSVVARRLTDLRDRGLVTDSGWTREGASARQLIAWCATEAGRQASGVAA